MKIAVDIGSNDGGNSVRGIGVHTTELLQALGQEGKKVKGLKVEGVYFSKSNLSKFDLVHYTSFHPHFLTLPSQKPAKKVIVTIHDLIPLIYPKYYPPGFKGRLRFLEQKRRLKNVDAIITISETSKKDICRFLKVDPNIVHVIHLAPKNIFKRLETGKWELEIKKRYNLPDNFVLYVGDINYNKNIPTLIKACKKVGITLVMVGKNALKIEEFAKTNHPEHVHLKEILNFLSASDVLRLGFIPDNDLVKIYNLSAVYCQPSFYEGFGLPLLEAFSCQTPVAASRIQAHVEIAESACVFFDPKDVNDMAEKIDNLLKDRVLRENMIKLGKKNVSNFAWEKTARQTVEVYRRYL